VDGEQSAVPNNLHALNADLIPASQSGDPDAFSNLGMQPHDDDDNDAMDTSVSVPQETVVEKGAPSLGEEPAWDVDRCFNPSWRELIQSKSKQIREALTTLAAKTVAKNASWKAINLVKRDLALISSANSTLERVHINTDKMRTLNILRNEYGNLCEALRRTASAPDVQAMRALNQNMTAVLAKVDNLETSTWIRRALVGVIFKAQLELQRDEAATRVSDNVDTILKDEGARGILQHVQEWLTPSAEGNIKDPFEYDADECCRTCNGPMVWSAPSCIECAFMKESANGFTGVFQMRDAELMEIILQNNNPDLLSIHAVHEATQATVNKFFDK
jgi:hypothetical protein